MEPHTLHGPDQDWLTVSEANAWCQLPKGYLDRLVKLKLIAPPQELSAKTKRWHWQYVVAIKWSISLGYIRVPPRKKGPNDDPNEDEDDGIEGDLE